MRNASSLKPSRPGRDNVCAVVISYFPQGDLLSRLRRIRPQVADLLIVDNGSSVQSADCLLKVETEIGSSVIRNSANLGVSAALNQGAEWARKKGYEWILTLDQDTVVADDMVQVFSVLYEECPENENVAVIGSNYINPVRGTPSVVFDRANDRSWQEVKTVITSGSLISLPAFVVIGSFRDELFIDYVDFEYCLRARSRGYKIIVARKCLMEHAIGTPTLHQLPWKRTVTTNHPPIRRYFIVRNQMVLAREYLRKEPVWAIATLYRQLKQTIIMCVFEKDVLLKLRYTGMGLIDGLMSNFSRRLSSAR